MPHPNDSAALDQERKNPKSTTTNNNRAGIDTTPRTASKGRHRAPLTCSSKPDSLRHFT